MKIFVAVIVGSVTLSKATSGTNTEACKSLLDDLSDGQYGVRKALFSAMEDSYHKIMSCRWTRYR